MTFTRSERAALCDLLDQLGPEAPTLCTGWTTRDLAAHLVLREQRPDAALGIVARPLHGWQERVRRGYLHRPFPELVQALRAGPPAWSPFALPGVEQRVNQAELFVHHEDVRRAQPGWEPRSLPPADEKVLAATLHRMGRLLFRRSPVGVVLRRPDGRTVTARPGEPAVTLSGPVSELLLYAFGRRDQARVEISGDDDARARFAQTPLRV